MLGLKTGLSSTSLKAIEQTRQALAGFEIAVDAAKKRLAQFQS